MLAAAGDTAKTIAAIVTIGLILPLVLLKARDRGYLKTAFGALALLAALGVAAALYNHFRQNAWDGSGWVGVGIAAALLGLGAKWIRDGGPGIEFLPPDFQCDELTASVAKARAALPRFLEQVDKNVDGAFVKFPLRTPRGNTEHIWGYVHSFRDGRFNVSLANVPFDAEQGPDGRRDVPIGEVEDWQIMLPDGKIKGAYSLIALFEHVEKNGRLNRRRREQKASLLDA